MRSSDNIHLTQEGGYQLDLFPTSCDLAGLPAPDTLDGKSFLPLLKDPQAEGKPAAFTSIPAM